MPFIPATVNLNQLEEEANFSHTIRYVSPLGVSMPVTITPSETNQTVSISDNIISGKYTSVFNYQIKYRTFDDKLLTVNNWPAVVQAIANRKLFEIYSYTKDTAQHKDYTYTATANSESFTYTIAVNNSWSAGRNQLVKLTNFTSYQKQFLIKWINNYQGTISWKNYIEKIIDWES